MTEEDMDYRKALLIITELNKDRDVYGLKGKYVISLVLEDEEE